MEKIYIDGKEMQVSDRIATTIRGFDLATNTNLLGPSTSTVRLPNSVENGKQLKFPDNPHIPDPKGWEDMRISVVSGGIPLLQNGRAILTSGNSREISFNVIGRTRDVYDELGALTLKDIDYGFAEPLVSYPGNTNGLPLVWPQIETWIRPDYSATSPIEGAFNPYGKKCYDGYAVPFVAKSWMLDKIFTHIGYQWVDTILQNYGHYTKSYVSLQVPKGKRMHYTDQQVSFSEWQHPVNCLDFVKWVLNQYGCVLVVTRDACIPVPYLHLQTLKGKANDWSDKIHEAQPPEFSYENGFAKTNRWAYSDYDATLMQRTEEFINFNGGSPGVTITDSRVDYYGEIESSNKNAQAVREFTNGFHPGIELTVTTALGYPRKFLYIPCFDPNEGAAGEFTEEYPIHDVIIPDNGTTYTNAGGTPETWTGTLASFGTINGNMKVPFFSSQEDNQTVQNDGLEYGLDYRGKLHPQFFSSGFAPFIREHRSVTAYFNLDPVDLKPYADVDLAAVPYIDEYLSRIYPIYCKSLGGYFVIKSIDNYISGQPVKVELIKI